MPQAQESRFIRRLALDLAAAAPLYCPRPHRVFCDPIRIGRACANAGRLHEGGDHDPSLDAVGRPMPLRGLLATANPRLQSADESEKADSTAVDIKTIGDISTMSGVEPVPVAGIGLVTRLESTGGGVPPGPERTALEEALKKKGVENIKELFNSKTTSLVHVSAYVPAGVHKGDPIDIYVIGPRIEPDDEPARRHSRRMRALQLCQFQCD